MTTCPAAIAGWSARMPTASVTTTTILKSLRSTYRPGTSFVSGAPAPSHADRTTTMAARTTEARRTRRSSLTRLAQALGLLFRLQPEEERGARGDEEDEIARHPHDRAAEPLVRRRVE